MVEHSIETLQDAIASIESGSNAYALRFEPEWFARHLEPKDWTKAHAACQRVHSCSMATARMICATSWGKYQIMGFNLYDDAIGYQKTVFDFASSASDQDDAFQKFVSFRGIDFTLSELCGSSHRRLEFAQVYNGASDYAQRIVDVLERAGYNVT